MRVLAEDLRVRMEAHLGAAPVLHAPEGLELALRHAAREDLPVEGLGARDLDLENIGQGIDDRDADAVQAAARLVDLGIELPARVQGGHDDLEGGFLRELGMRVDRDAAPVVGDRQEAAFLELDLDEGGMAGDRLVHGVVDHFGEEVMQGLLVGAADIHARPAPNRLEPFQDFDGGRVVAGLGRRARGRPRTMQRRARARPSGPPVCLAFSSRSCARRRRRKDRPD